VEPVHAGPPPALTATKAFTSEPEDLLHLMPDRQHEEHRKRDEHAQRDDETQPRAGGLPFASEARVAARTVVVVRAVDRLGVDRRILRSCDAPRWLGHPGSLVPVPVA